jgi:GNAT superfamily N-acetyltransferase
MRESDLEEAARIFRVAFGTFIGLPDPDVFAADRNYIHSRWHANPCAALCAEVDGALAGSNFVAGWGSFGFFGPLTVRPNLWNQRVAQRLLEPTIALFETWGVREAALYTFANSPRHIALYQKFGFWPRFLTAFMSSGVGPRETPYTRYSDLSDAERPQALSATRELTDSIYAGLDVTSEVRSVFDQNLGDTVQLWGGDRLDAFAVCHCGEGTEAGRENCYLKFAAARSGGSFGHLLDACETFAAKRGLKQLQGGVNLNRSQAYRQMLQRGFRTASLGVAMHRPNSPAYNRPDVFAIDDWR